MGRNWPTSLPCRSGPAGEMIGRPMPRARVAARSPRRGRARGGAPADGTTATGIKVGLHGRYGGS
jgi:hypothetical protein